MYYQIEYTPCNTDQLPIILEDNLPGDFERAYSIKRLYSDFLEYNTVDLIRVLTEDDISHYVGIDCSLDIALFEYGLIWDQSAYNEDPEASIDFIVGDPYYYNEDLGYTRFYRSCFDLRDFNELFHVKSWCNAFEVARCSGLSIKELYRGFPYTLYDFIMYYGIENFMARPYHVGSYFKIELD